jgi:hypothetical protein
MASPLPSLLQSMSLPLILRDAAPSPCSCSTRLASLPRFPPLQLPHAMLPDPRQALATQRAPNPTQPRHRPCPSLHSTRLEPRQPDTPASPRLRSSALLIRKNWQRSLSLR